MSTKFSTDNMFEDMFEDMFEGGDDSNQKDIQRKFSAETMVFGSQGDLLIDFRLDSKKAVLILVGNPNNEEVYHRKLKSQPIVELRNVLQKDRKNYGVEAVACYMNSNDGLLGVLEGKKEQKMIIKRFDGSGPMVWTDLKLMHTSKQHKNQKFRIKFTLKKIVNCDFEDYDSEPVFTCGIEVFSHSVYLNKNKNKKNKKRKISFITDVIPYQIDSKDERVTCCLIGSDFPEMMKVKIDNQALFTIRHESTSATVKVPPGIKPGNHEISIFQGKGWKRTNKYIKIN